MLGSFTLLPTYHRTYGVLAGWESLQVRHPFSVLGAVPQKGGGQDGCPLDWLGFNTCPPLKAAPSSPSQWCFLGCQFKSGGCVYTRNFHIWGPGLQVIRQEDFKPGNDKEQVGSHLFSNEATNGKMFGRAASSQISCHGRRVGGSGLVGSRVSESCSQSALRLECESSCHSYVNERT